MKKSIGIIASVIIALFIIVQACSKEGSPAAPGVTQTATNTPAGTSTASPTFTATATNTRVVILIEDAEDNDEISAVVCAGCTNTYSYGLNPGGNIELTGPVSTGGGHPLLGNYYSSLTGTSERDNATLIIVYIPSRVTPYGGVASDASVNLEFDYMLNCSTAASLYINLMNEVPSTMYIDYSMALTADGTWHHVSIPVASMGGYPVLSVMENVTTVVFGVKSSDNSGLTPDARIEFNFDNIQLVR